MIQKASTMGDWWLAASSWQRTRSCIMFCAEFFVKHQITQMTQPPYSPDLAPCDSWLFPKLKSPLKGRDEALGNLYEHLWETFPIKNSKLLPSFPSFLMSCPNGLDILVLDWSEIPLRGQLAGLETFWLSHLGRGCYGHTEVRDQEYS